jgi:exonuclease SbcC
LRRLSLSGFMSWADLDLDLSACDVVGVTGRVGHGKSALLDALLWCLFGVGRAGADAMLRQGGPRGFVEVEGEASGQMVRVRRERERDKATTLTLEVDGRSETRHTVPETQAAIIDLLGVSADTLLATAVMVQGRSDEFVRLRPGERMALLADLVLVDPYAAWHDAAKRGRDAAREAGSRAEGRAAALAGDAEAAAGLREMATQLRLAAELARAEADQSKQAAREAEDAARAAREQTSGRGATAERRAWLLARLRAIADERVEHRGEVAAGEAILALLPPSPVDRTVTREQVERADAATRAAAEARVRMSGIEAQLAAARNEVARLERTALDVATLPCRGEGPYAACPLLLAMPSRRDVLDANATVQALEAQREEAWAVAEPESRLAAEASRLAATWQNEDRAAAAMPDLLARHRERATEASERVARARAALERLDAEEADVLVTLATLTEPTPEALARVADREAFAAAMAEKAAQDWEAALALSERAAVAMRDAERAAKAREDWLAAVAEAAAESEQSARFAALADAWHPYGIPRLIVEDAIPQIEAHANDALSRLPGGFVLRLATSREKRTGGSSDTLDVAVDVAGRERDYALLSGGERFRVDLALRLGIAGLLAERSGRRWQTLWLDEPLAPGDEQEREAVTESIAALADQYPLVVIVSHDAEFADVLPWALRVTKDGVSQAELVQQ